MLDMLREVTRSCPSGPGTIPYEWRSFYGVGCLAFQGEIMAWAQARHHFKLWQRGGCRNSHTTSTSIGI